jgi:hypothetical protein
VAFRPIISHFDTVANFAKSHECQRLNPKSVPLMRKTIVINTLLILGYYLVLQLLIWVAMVLR